MLVLGSGWLSGIDSVGQAHAFRALGTHPLVRGSWLVAQLHKGARQRMIDEGGRMRCFARSATATSATPSGLKVIWTVTGGGCCCSDPRLIYGIPSGFSVAMHAKLPAFRPNGP